MRTDRGSSVPGNATAQALAKRPIIRFAAPGTESTFTTTTGIRSTSAAHEHATAPNPPTATTTRGRRRTSSASAAAKAAAIPQIAATLRRLRRRSTPRPGRRVSENPASGTRRRSIPRRAPTKWMAAGAYPEATRARATAIAGNT